MGSAPIGKGSHAHHMRKCNFTALHDPIRQRAFFAQGYFYTCLVRGSHDSFEGASSLGRLPCPNNIFRIEEEWYKYCRNYTFIVYLFQKWHSTHMDRKELPATLRVISGRSVPGGGFSEQPGAPFRVDATAWAILALKAVGAHSDLIESALSRLASDQLSDGRVCVTQDQPQTFWPTPMAILAWHGSGAYRKHQERAIKFLLTATGKHGKKSADAPFTHDTSIRGWPWIEYTFSWVEPTSMSVLSLCLSGFGANERVNEAVQMLMDRQLPSGGWNIGSSIIYGRETYPQLDCTGLALTTLARHVEKREIKRSLDYMKSQAVSCRTPLSLGWTLFGLGAWDERPTEAERWIVECLSRQKKFGAYGTTILSLLLLAYKAKSGFIEAISCGIQGK